MTPLSPALAKSLLPSAEEARHCQLYAGALVKVQVIPESLEAYMPLVNVPATMWLPSAEQARLDQALSPAVVSVQLLPESLEV